jgi:hypothetical protein
MVPPRPRGIQERIHRVTRSYDRTAFGARARLSRSTKGGRGGPCFLGLANEARPQVLVSHDRNLSGD